MHESILERLGASKAGSGGALSGVQAGSAKVDPTGPGNRFPEPVDG